ncbi:hypothetical protein [Paenibacillus elgii]|uniref:hypothetical protein n=1 Tax=Paenibacillus elgii TaxID=189691 RepID=UPI002040CC8E|nr:hypothetical protein [Paenibacillus elgii]MCM3271155.1 hypothetical protein [Paenibacillus elgii]
MNYFIVNIFNQFYFFNEDSEKRSQDFLISSKYYLREEYDSDVENETITKIILAKGDGVFLDINSLGNKHFFNVYFLEWHDEYIQENYFKYNTDATQKIEEWFQNQYIEASENAFQDMIYSEQKNEDGYFVTASFSDIWYKGEELLRELDEKNVSYEVVRYSKSSFNKGASGFGETVIIWVAKKFGDLVWDSVKKKVTGDRATITSSPSIDYLIDYITETLNESKIHLELTGIDILESGDNQISFSTPFKDIIIICDKKYKVKSLKVNNKTQTGI